MSAISKELYDALIEAGASEPKAEAAARTDNNVAGRLAVVEAELKVIKWMVGGVGFGVLLLVIQNFIPS